MLIDFLKNTFAFDANSPLLFTQFYFWAFFATVFAVFSLMGNKVLMRNAFLFFVSIFFYYKTSGLFTLILIASVAMSYIFGRLIHGSAGRWRTFWLATGIASSLAVLFYYKYAYFFAAMLYDLLGITVEVVDYVAMAGNLLCGAPHFSIDYILLPVGISFFTFQCISYLMDIYRRRILPVVNVLDYGFYVSFFPQLVAGPIVRANEFMPQLHRPFFLGRRQFGISVFWIINGLAKKIILSDYIAVNFVDRVFANPTMFTGFENLAALFGYSLQVYADFSGYTDIATGVAMLMGFYLPRNFNSPYKAPNAGNFWKRWHISLSKWLQDYLYIPMGGNRRASVGTYAVIIGAAVVGTVLSGNVWVAVVVLSVVATLAIVFVMAPGRRKAITTNINSMNTMLLGGMWHGASWNFVIWGGLNGLGMIVFKIWRPLGHLARCGLIAALWLLMWLLASSTGQPIFNIGTIWLGCIAVGTVVRAIYALLRLPFALGWLGTAWAIAQTFVFITFTRLFFRSGSNLNPAEANTTAWNTAKDMVNQIGGRWNMAQLPNMLSEYAPVLLLIVAGMVIHWLPERLKRRYRLAFAALPLPLMALVVVLVVFVVYQFVTADLQKFIYFQF